MSELNTNYAKWLDKIEAEDKAHGKYRERAAKVENRFIEESEEINQRTLGQRFNILYSNTETIQSSILSELPKPDVRRRFPEQNIDSPEGKLENAIHKKVATVMERALSYSIDEYDFQGQIDKALTDRLVPGIGVVRIEYDPDIRTETKRIPVDVIEDMDEEGNDVEHYRVGEKDVEPKFLEDGTPYIEEEEDTKIWERVKCRHIPWKRFRWQPSDGWQNVMWAGFEHILDLETLKEQFPDKYKKIPLGFSQEGNKAQGDGNSGTHAKVYEIFCKRSKTVKIFCAGMDDFIDVLDDPMELEGFYPFPMPLFANPKSGKLIPNPEFTFYQDQAEELDNVTARINGLMNELKHRGIYDGMFADTISSLKSSGDGDLVPVDNFREAFSQGRGLDDVVKYFPNEDIIRTVQALIQEREQLKQTIYEITGISDILRGSSKASETLGAQRIKAQTGGLRIRRKQQQSDYFIRQIFRMKAEVIANHFDKETLSAITGIDVTDDMMVLIRDDALRSFKIDVESDSTVFRDAQEEQKNRVELLTSITQYMGAVVPGIQSGIVPIELAKELLLFAVRAFKSGREIEDALDEIGGEVQPGPGPNQPGGAGAANQLPPELQGAIGMAGGQPPGGAGF